ncbi:guanylate cyclase soluble subunit beta-2-like [Protopterus annectens]|uniref:guanylate cyclase soluble subunit beta-2-like n=1 Tax=Protopterus annectens TaxID=7888 RepID=UPI001CFBD1FD|nr:guanylate cyclase soluble subunit beta-2-like [Protopterus annectens]
MGSSCGASVANYVMGYWEANILGKLPGIMERAVLYTRFLDDIFILFRGTEMEALTFVENINVTTEFLRFTSKFSTSETDYLDVSSHPYQQKRSIVKGQLVRAGRMCSTLADFTKECELLREMFSNRGYPDQLLLDLIEEVRCKRLNGFYKPLLIQQELTQQELTHIDLTSVVLTPETSVNEEYGFINTCLKSLVIENFGEEQWERLRTQAEVQDVFMTYEVYDDVITLRLVQQACKMLDVSSEAVLKLFGEYFFSFCKVSGYDRMLRTLGGNLMEFIENLDALHSYLALSYQEMNAPSFRVEKRTNGSLLLHYYSDRRGLCHIVPGIIEAVAKDFFHSEVIMEILNQSEEDGRTGKKEHVVFLVTQKPVTQIRRGKSGKELLKNNITEDRENTIILIIVSLSSMVQYHIVPATEKILYIKKTEEATLKKLKERYSTLPVNWAGKSHWEAIRSIVKPGQGNILSLFKPVYPERLWIEEKTFCSAFPFHLVFDEALNVKQAGVTIQKLIPGLQALGVYVDEYFSIVHPEIMFTISSIRKFVNSQFVLKTRREIMPQSWKAQPMLKLRGQMIWMESLQCMLYLCSPKLRSLQELEERRMHISDIAQHDTTRDLILLNQQRLAEIELSNQLERKKEELRILSKHLEIEKKKTETLLYAMLPKHVANQLKEGKKVEAGEFKECTILFSDVVTFTNICAACEPIHIVNMLNSMYSRFDRLTNVHDVYKVETIGDAYMVVGGVPLPVVSHAERVANFALGMRAAAKEVMNPVTGEPIQIRVGIHTGSVLAGVVGEKMPRYCLFGDTVNTASRMESHGLPDKIHLSPTAYRALQHKCYEIIERGEIEVKGKGKMLTYFLIQNLQVTEDEIMGRVTESLAQYDMQSDVYYDYNDDNGISISINRKMGK